MWCTDGPECVLCGFCVKWKALCTEVCETKCEVIVSSDLDKNVIKAHSVAVDSQVQSSMREVEWFLFREPWP